MDLFDLKCLWDLLTLNWYLIWWMDFSTSQSLIGNDMAMDEKYFLN